jgi:hypothetical protein
VVVDKDLEVRLIVHVLQSLHADLVLHSRRLDIVPRLARVPLLHRDIMYHFIISTTSNKCIDINKAVR